MRLVSHTRETLSRIVIVEGTGTAQNPLREVTYLVTDAGEVVYRKDHGSEPAAVDETKPDPDDCDHSWVTPPAGPPAVCEHCGTVDGLSRC